MSNTTDISGAEGAADSTTGSIELRSITKKFEDTVAVDDIDVEVRSGELLVLLGPSGCGKTTTLRMIGGLETPTTGTITRDGREITTKPPQKREISIVFQNYALYPHLSVRGNLTFSLGKTDLSDDQIDSKVEQTAELLGIGQLLEKNPDQLSGGQQQRVALGRTIVQNPKVFLMDEPLASLDAKLRVDTRTEIRQLQQELDVTTLYVTHNQEEAMSIADRIAVMNDGQIEQIGTPEEVYEEPNNEFVADFLGEPSINILNRARSDGSSATVLSETGLTFSDAVHSIGIRPQDLHLRSARGDVSADAVSDPIPVAITLIEPLGDGYEIAMEYDGTELTMISRALPTDVREKLETEVVFDVDGIYRFDADAELIEHAAKMAGD